MKPKWYNWVGDPIWDDYCRLAWIFVFLPIGLPILGLIIWGIIAKVMGIEV